MDQIPQQPLPPFGAESPQQQARLNPRDEPPSGSGFMFLLWVVGAIEIPAFWHPTSAKLITPGNEPKIVTGGQGFHFEIAEAMKCVAAGKLESDLMPLDESIAVARTADRVRDRRGGPPLPRVEEVPSQRRRDP